MKEVFLSISNRLEIGRLNLNEVSNSLAADDFFSSLNSVTFHSTSKGTFEFVFPLTLQSSIQKFSKLPPAQVPPVASVAHCYTTG
jgi:hypothetical protein